MYKDINLSNVAFDIDGTVVNFTKSFIEIAEKRHGITGFTSNDILTYHIEDHMDLPKKETYEIVNFILENPFESNLEFFPDAKEILEEIMEDRMVIFISNRHVNVPIIEWFQASFNSTNFRVYTVSNPENKLEVLQSLKIEYYFDDRLETCELLNISGLKPILYAQPWNRINTKIPTVFDWNEIKDLLMRR